MRRTIRKLSTCPDSDRDGEAEASIALSSHQPRAPVPCQASGACGCLVRAVLVTRSGYPRRLNSLLKNSGSYQGIALAVAYVRLKSNALLAWPSDPTSSANRAGTDCSAGCTPSDSLREGPGSRSPSRGCLPLSCTATLELLWLLTFVRTSWRCDCR